jgi:30S ribosomal protein S31
MGKGDKKTKRGKIVIGSSGVRRARKKKNRKPATLSKPETKPKVTLEQNQVVLVPEITPVVEQVEEKAPRKTTAKKAVAKKPVKKVDEDGAKPAKSKKKTTKPSEDLSEKKEGTE